jgi:hypothetical protein
MRPDAVDRAFSDLMTGRTLTLEQSRATDIITQNLGHCR